MAILKKALVIWIEIEKHDSEKRSVDDASQQLSEQSPQRDPKKV
jgi:hypothetical protein